MAGKSKKKQLPLEEEVKVETTEKVAEEPEKKTDAGTTTDNKTDVKPEPEKKDVVEKVTEDVTTTTGPSSGSYDKTATSTTKGDEETRKFAEGEFNKGVARLEETKQQRLANLDEAEKGETDTYTQMIDNLEAQRKAGEQRDEAYQKKLRNREFVRGLGDVFSSIANLVGVGGTKVKKGGAFSANQPTPDNTSALRKKAEALLQDRRLRGDKFEEQRNALSDALAKVKANYGKERNKVGEDFQRDVNDLQKAISVAAIRARTQESVTESRGRFAAQREKEKNATRERVAQWDNEARKAIAASKGGSQSVPIRVSYYDEMGDLKTVTVDKNSYDYMLPKLFPDILAWLKAENPGSVNVTLADFKDNPDELKSFVLQYALDVPVYREHLLALADINDNQDKPKKKTENKTENKAEGNGSPFDEYK